MPNHTCTANWVAKSAHQHLIPWVSRAKPETTCGLLHKDESKGGRESWAGWLWEQVWGSPCKWVTQNLGKIQLTRKHVNPELGNGDMFQWLDKQQLQWLPPLPLRLASHNALQRTWHMGYFSRPYSVAWDGGRFTASPQRVASLLPSGLVLLLLGFFNTRATEWLGTLTANGRIGQNSIRSCLPGTVPSLVVLWYPDVVQPQ